MRTLIAFIFSIITYATNGIKHLTGKCKAMYEGSFIRTKYPKSKVCFILLGVTCAFIFFQSVELTLVGLVAGGLRVATLYRVTKLKLGDVEKGDCMLCVERLAYNIGHLSLSCLCIWVAMGNGLVVSPFTLGLLAWALVDTIISLIGTYKDLNNNRYLTH